MSDLKELVDGYIKERDDARNQAAFFQGQAAQWQSLATALAFRLENANSLNLTQLTKVHMENAALWILEPKQLKSGTIKLKLTKVPEPEVTDEGSGAA